MDEPKQEEKLPPYVIEGARSSRSRCKTCRRKIERGNLRIGMLIEGPFGTGYLWHHLKCAARRRFDQVAEAYALEAWKEAKQAPQRIPDLEDLRKHMEQLSERKKERRELPYAELDPSGRARCKHCNEPIEKGSLRIVLGRGVEFGGQVRVGPINVHPRCVAQELQNEDCATEAGGFAEALRANSPAISAEILDAGLAQVGDLGLKPVLIGIAGPSGSGKTALARRLVERLGDGATRLVLDNYYRDLDALEPALRDRQNFDDPDALDRGLLIEQIGRLVRGLAIDAPVYDFATHMRKAATVRVEPGRYVVADGLFALYWPEIRELIDLAVFLEADEQVCLARRIERDVNERGRSVASVREMYEQTVRPMHRRFVLPTRPFADLILDGTRPLDDLVDEILARF